MSPSEAAAYLNHVEFNHREVLYKARWDEKTASEVVPRLVAILESNERDTLLRAMGAFVTIGPLAWAAATKIVPHLQSIDTLIFNAAAIALARVSLKKPKLAVQPLIAAAKVQGRVQYAMFALIDLGTGAKASAPVFERAFEDDSPRIRRLALRGLVAIGAEEETITRVVNRALHDKTKEVRNYATKLLTRLRTQ